VEIVTGPVPAQSPFIPLDAKIVVGAVAPASPDPIPIVLLPGFEYRMLEWRHPSTHEIHWRVSSGESLVGPARTRTSPQSPWRAARSGLKMGVRAPVDVVASWFVAGRGLVGRWELRLWALQCCFEHAS
jgi:hypothetical protein